MRQISPKALQSLLATTSLPAKIIDVREAHELKHGMLNDADHIPMQAVPDKLATLARYQHDTVVLVCRSGKRSNQVGQFLEQAGFTDIINLSGGMNAWATDVDSRVIVY